MAGSFFDANVISNYNQYISDRLGQINVPKDMQSVTQFEDILNEQLDAVGDKMFEGKIEFNEFPSSQDSEKIAIPESSGSGAGELLENFKRGFGNALNSVNEKQLASQRAIETFATGGNIDVHEVMIAAEKSSLSMQMALQMRNKMISFYNEFKNLGF